MQLVFHRRNDRPRNATGFTLVELAVVMTLTSLLCALLFPALSSSKEKARRSVCKNDLRQLYLVVANYAGDNNDVLPSAADNVEHYHSIRLSTATFTNLVENYAEGVSNIFYCPNLVFNLGTGIIGANDAYGYLIGYSYLADDVVGTVKGADTVATSPIKLGSVSPTNELWADANYWAPNNTTYGPAQKLAPHTTAGAAVSIIPTGSTATNSASIGAAGGNIEFYDGSVRWRTLGSMGTYSASSGNDSFGNW